VDFFLIGGRGGGSGSGTGLHGNAMDSCIKCIVPR
jgi:hypothetical protein